MRTVNVIQGTLLVVDDEPDLLEILNDVLRPFIRDIRRASNGLDALKMIKGGEVDAVLSDINMPRMSGLQLLAEIRHFGMEIPFVVLTGYGDKANLQEAIRLDATDFLEKPFGSEHVIQTMLRATRLGVAIKAMEDNLHRLYESSDLPPDEITRIKAFKRTIAAMKMRFEGDRD